MKSMLNQQKLKKQIIIDSGMVDIDFLFTHP